MKKFLCLFISLLILFTCSSVGITALAASPEDVSAAINAYDTDALTEGGLNALTDASNYPADALAALDALVEDYNTLSQEEVNAMAVEDYMQLADILYQAKLWIDWDAAGRPTDFYSVLMIYSAWSNTSSDKYKDAAERLSHVPEWKNTLTARPFFELMASVTEPYTNADIAAAKEAYAAISVTLWSLLRDQDPEETEAAVNIYHAVLAAVGPDEQVDNEVDLSVYPAADPGEVKATENTVKRILKLLAVYDIDAEQTLKELPEKIATGKNVITVMTALAGLHPMLTLFVNPQALADALAKDSQFGGAADKLNALITAGHTTFIETDNDGETVWRADEDPEIVFTSADFGFADGDLYGFIDALGAALGSVETLIGLLGTFRNTKDTANGVYKYGLYEELIPLLELLDLTVPSSVEFTDVVDNTRYTDTDGNEYADPVRAGVNAILTPVADYLTGEFAEAPVDAVERLLPKLAYAVDSGMLQQTVDSLLANFASFGLSIDLSTDGIWAIVEGKLVSGEDAGIDIDGDGEKEPLPLTYETFVALVKGLAYCAEAVVKPSVSAHEANRLGLNTSVERTSTALFSWLTKTVKTEEVRTFIDELIDGANVSDFVKNLLGHFIDMIAKDGGMAKLVRLIDSPLFPLALIILRLVKLLSTRMLELKSHYQTGT